MGYDFDPPSARLEGDTVLERITRAYEDATDAYATACNQSAEAENYYLKLFQIAWVFAVEEKVPATTRKLHVDNVLDVCEAHQDWNRATAREKSARAKCTELQNRLTAAMSHQRFIREAT